MDNTLCKITLSYNEETEALTCDKGSNLMDVFHKYGIYLEAPCGGKGLCGKCKVRVQGEGVSAPTPQELKFLSRKEKDQGYRLACCTTVMGDLHVFMDGSGDGAQIVSHGTGYFVDIDPGIRKKFVSLDRPSVEDQRDDFQRLVDALDITEPDIPLRVLRRLPYLLRDNDFSVTVVYDREGILAVEPGDTSSSNYGVAVDIGTTTVVSYLMDLNTGKQLDVVSRLNAQKPYGSDVISRIAYTKDNPDGLQRLQAEVVSQIDDMVHLLADKNNIDINNIYSISIVGNTTMLHLLTGLNTEHIAAAPFAPVATRRMVYSAEEVGFDIGPWCQAFLLPNISGYVGADIVAGILSSGMVDEDDLSLLIDIGTNGEIALGNSSQAICCSTAAGPAFEGANIRNGVGGISGAINTVKVEEGKIKYTTITGSPAIGICGSGIVDALAVLLEYGIVDETGRILEPDEIESDAGQKLAANITEIDDMPAFVIADGSETKNGDPIVITQKDVREIQLAKAAIAAGINVLIKKMGKQHKDVAKVYLAGGFGSYIDRKNAVRIGLLPKELEDRIVAVGNAAGTGAMMSLISYECLLRCDIIRTMTRYIELSNTPEFQDEYVNCMYF